MKKLPGGDPSRSFPIPFNHRSFRKADRCFPMFFGWFCRKIRMPGENGHGLVSPILEAFKLRRNKDEVGTFAAVTAVQVQRAAVHRLDGSGL